MCYMRHGLEFCDIQVWELRNGRKWAYTWVEFRGPPYQLWPLFPEPCPARDFHDALEGWHSCVLHTDDYLYINDTMLGFDRAWELYSNG